MIKVLIDCDPGHDDIIAIMVALAHPDHIDILGATTVAGNQTLEKVTNNLLKVLDHLGVKMDVSMGYDKPIRRPLEVQPLAHGESGMDGPVLKDPVSKPVVTRAVDYLYEKLIKSEEKVVLIGLAPLTNIAMLLKQHPVVSERIEKIVLMGGSLYSGNILPKAEFNIYHDPEAAKIVFNSGVPIVMSGLEVCQAGSILHTETELLKGKGKASQLCYDLLEFFCRYGKNRGSDRSPIFDMTPVIYLLKPEMFEAEAFQIDIETEGNLCRGMTVADIREFRERKQNNVNVLMDVDREKFIRFFLDSMNILDKAIANKEAA